MTIRVATAPVSYGVIETTVGQPGLPAGPALAREIADAGYAGTELGPPGFFGDGEALGELLTGLGLDLVASFLPLRFAHVESRADDDVALDGALDTLAAATAAMPGAALPRVLLCDAFDDPGRMLHAGAIESHPETWLSEGRFGTLVDGIHRAAGRCRERGFPVSFHHHAGTYVETPREIASLAAAMDTSLLGLCFDSGHAAFGGGDALALLREYVEIVDHVHMKDVDLALLAAVHAAGGGLMQAWADGVFRPLGTGDARVDDCLAELRARGYAGWLVVEQDRVLGPEAPFAAAATDGRANRAWLAARDL